MKNTNTKNYFDRLIKYIKKTSRVFVNAFTGIISLCVKRDKNIYAFGSYLGWRFADNSMYLYIYLNEYTNRRAIWITKDRNIKNILNMKGFEAYLSYGLKGIYYQLKAKYHIVSYIGSDINSYLSVGAIKVNLWHGMPIKKLTSYYNQNEPFFLIRRFKFYKWFTPGFWDPKNIFSLVTSKQMIAKMVNLCPEPEREDRIIVANYPRNEMNMYHRNVVRRYLDSSAINVLKYIMILKKENYKIFGYFPTFRDWGNDILFTSDKECLQNFLDYLEYKKIIIVTKFHYNAKMINKELEKAKDELINNSNIIILKEEDDINYILPYLDLLISDYSSIIYDYMWYEKPIILYPYDEKKYNDNRGFAIDYNEFNPGKKVYNINELQSEIDNYINNRNYIDPYIDNIKSIRSKVFETDVACKRIIDFLEKIG